MVFISRAIAISICFLVLITIIAVGVIVGILVRCDGDNNQSHISKLDNVEPVLWKNPRLPKSLVPLHYIVDLSPDMEPDLSGNFWFIGASEVTFTVTEETSEIIIHSNKLNYSDINLFYSKADESRTQLRIFKHWVYKENQYLVIELSFNLDIGKNFTLQTAFSGIFSDDLRGLYRSTYTDSFGQEKTLAVSQMQPYDARKVFPCFDEPEFKATFEVYLRHKAPYFALSNMPFVVTNKRGNWSQTKFETTPPMSTYLLGLCVSEFGYVQANGNDSMGIQTRIYGRTMEINKGNGNYAKTITPTILDLYANYFGVEYVLPKSDQLAVPDLALNGMENWGLVVYHEIALLYNPAFNSESDKQYVAKLVAHELTHQWFGNAVTAKWWNELWLNEGFANYFMYFGQNEVGPNWQMFDQFVVRDFHLAMNVDALQSSRPLVGTNVTTREQISAMFDIISYDKGSCILRMFSFMIGEYAFKQGIQTYLSKYTFQNVVHDQLFEELEYAALNIGNNKLSSPPRGFVNTMKAWVLQMGYPVVSMVRSTKNQSLVIVSQKRFLWDYATDFSQPESEFGYKWTIPFWYTTQNENHVEWLRPKHALVLEIPEDQFFIGNYEVFGYYRVNYGLENWKSIINVLNQDYRKIKVKNRAQLIDDAFNLAKAKLLDYGTALNITLFLQKDFSYITWKSSIGVFNYLKAMLAPSEANILLSKYLLLLSKPVFNNLTWNNQGSHLEKLLRPKILGLRCGSGDESCIQRAVKLFKKWKNKSQTFSVSPDLRSVVYCQGISNGNSDDWDFVWSKYQVESDAHEKLKLRNALACSDDKDLINRYLNYTTNKNKIKIRDVIKVYKQLCSNGVARKIVWNFLIKNWNYVYENFGERFLSLIELVDSCMAHFSTFNELEELVAFKNQNINKLGCGYRALDQAIENTRINIQWKAENQSVLIDWLSHTLNNGILM